MSRAQRRFRVSGKDLILDFSEYDVNHVIADQEESAGSISSDSRWSN